jgi:hypothetical protein
MGAYRAFQALGHFRTGMTMRAELVLGLEQEVLIGDEKRIIGKFQRFYEFVESPGHRERILDVPDREPG